MHKKHMRMPIVREFMTTKLVTIGGSMDIYTAIELLLRHKISGAPVVDADGSLVGVLSEKDCLRLFTVGALHRLPGGIVSDYMSKEVHSCHPDDELFAVAEIFMKNVFRRLPVIEDGKLVGQISRRDVLNASRRIWETPPVAQKWTDSVYIPEQVQAVLNAKSTHH